MRVIITRLFIVQRGQQGKENHTSRATFISSLTENGQWNQHLSSLPLLALSEFYLSRLRQLLRRLRCFEPFIELHLFRLLLERQNGQSPSVLNLLTRNHMAGDFDSLLCHLINEFDLDVS
jgi:hypothetical protein